MNIIVGNGSIGSMVSDLKGMLESLILQADNRASFFSLDSTTLSTVLSANCRKNSTKSRYSVADSMKLHRIRDSETISG